MPPTLDQLRQQAEKAVRDVGIPPRPAILTRLVRDLRADEPDMAAIGQLISSDAGLAAAMLKTVNSAAFGLAVRANSVKHALQLMGLATAGNLVTGLLLKQAFPLSRHPMMERFWETSSRVAEVSAQLARALKCADADAAHTLGLFRDCGMAALLGKHADYAELVASSAKPDGLRLADAENRRPETMRLVAVTTLADYACACVAGESVTRELELASDFAATQLGIGPAGKKQIVDFAAPEPIAA
mgnify:CR=1 FL=1